MNALSMVFIGPTSFNFSFVNEQTCMFEFLFHKVNIFSLCKQDASVQMSPFDNEEAVMKTYHS